MKRNIFIKSFMFNKNKITYKDKNFIVFCKQKTMKMFPNKNNDFSILGNIYYFLGENLFKKKIFFISRLDFGTLGIFLYPLKKSFFLNIRKQTNNNVFKKFYFLICNSFFKNKLKNKYNVFGFLKKKNNKVILVNKTDDDDNKKYFSNTEIELIDFVKFNKKYYSVFFCKINSGKTHQIRVHMKKNGNKILGDSKYGYVNKFFNRNNLHSWGVSFIYKKKLNSFFCFPNSTFIKYYRFLGFKRKTINERTN